MAQTDAAIPFALDRSAPVDLTDQVVTGLRGAIQSGVYQPGDRLPGIRDMARALRTSNIVVHRAIQQLASEGRVTARRRAGIHVRELDDPCWRAHALWIRPGGGSFFFAERDQAFCDHLEAARVRVTSVNHLHQQPEAMLDHVEAALKSLSITHIAIGVNPVGLVEDLGSVDQPILACIDESDVDTPRRVTANVVMDPAPALEAAARHVLELGRPRAAVFATTAHVSERAQRIFADFGLDLAAPRNRWRDSNDRIELAEATGHATALRLAEEGELPRLALVLDDHMARGFYTGLLEAGRRVPDDLQMIVWSNRGNRLRASHEFSRIENDPIEHGHALARALIEMIEGPAGLRRTYHLGPRFIVGQTTCPVDASLTRGHSTNSKEKM